MKTLKINTQLKDPKGLVMADDGVPITVGSIIEFNLFYNQTSDPYKAFKLAKKISLCETDEVEITEEEYIFIRESLTNSRTHTPIVTGQILEILE